MRYLKLFEKYTSSEKMHNVKDICLDLIDEGFVVSHTRHADDIINAGEMTVAGSTTVYLRRPIFSDFSEVKETLERLCDYLGNDIRFISILKENTSYWSQLYVRPRQRSGVSYPQPSVTNFSGYKFSAIRINFMDK
jgi:hypothetical protein